MMKIIRTQTIFSIIATCLIFSECINPASDQTKIISITDYKDSICLSEIVDTLNVIPLESGEGIVSSVSSITFSKNNIVVLDQNQKQILFYNHNGTFFSKIKALGKGPYEYVTISDYYFDQRSELLYVFDEVQKKIITFNKNGLPIKEISFPYSIGDFIVINDKFLCFNETAMNFSGGFQIYPGLFEIDSSGGFSKQVSVRNNGDLALITLDNYFHLHEEKTLLTVWGSDTIFEITNQGQTPYLYLNFHGYNLSGDYRSLPKSTRRLSEIVNSGMIYSMEPIIFSDSHLFIRYYINQATNYLIYSFKCDKYIATSKIINDLVHSPSDLRFVSNVGDNLVCVSWSSVNSIGNPLGGSSQNSLDNPQIIQIKLKNEI